MRGVISHKEFDEHQTCTTDPETGEALEVVFDLPKISNQINRFNLKHAPLGAAKYLDFYPLCGHARIISLSEGNTPLIKTKKFKQNFSNLFIKNEGANPTGVFKDRGSLVEISKALELKAKGIVCASTGNMAASVAAYSSRAGLPCYVFIPEGTPTGKLVQALAYGAKLIQIRGEYHDCVLLSEQYAKKHNFYLAGDYAFRLEGSKSIAFEIIEQLNWQVPDAIICPVGCGTNLAGIWKGFWEWHQLKLIDRLPKIIAVHPEGCDTIVSAALKNQKKYSEVLHPNTICSAVGINIPQDDIKILRAIHDSNGSGAIVSDRAILAAQCHLATNESIFTEPSGAIPAAALDKLLEQKIIKPSDTIVCICTGNGLKDPKSALLSFTPPQSIDPDLAQVEQIINRGSLQVKNAGSGSEEEILLTKLPDNSELKKIITKHFNYRPQTEVLSNISEEIGQFIERGKEVKKGDLLSIVEEAITDANAPQTPLKIIDFTTKNTMQGGASGEIICQFKQVKLQAEAEGVGPVDALIKALNKALHQQAKLWPKLTNFKVNVTSADEDAVVRVKMTMSDQAGNTARATASSPDIIVASLNAWQKGFNLLFTKQES